MGHDSLKNFYETNFSMMQYHKYNLSDLENMMPWERHIFIDLLAKQVKIESENMRDRLAIQKRIGK